MHRNEDSDSSRSCNESNRIIRTKLIVAVAVVAVVIVVVLVPFIPTIFPIMCGQIINCTPILYQSVSLYYFGYGVETFNFLSYYFCTANRCMFFANPTIEIGFFLVGLSILLLAWKKGNLA